MWAYILRAVLHVPEDMCPLQRPDYENVLNLPLSDIEIILCCRWMFQ
jgi:hypothetical protein